MRRILKQLGLILEIGMRPQSRAEQLRLKIERLRLSLPWLPAPEIAVIEPPIVVGAVGGSGTRVVKRILSDAGWWMGKRVDTRNGDSLPIAHFLDKWLRPLVAFPDVDRETVARAESDLERMIGAHRRGISGPVARWGWKNPRSLWLIPFFAARFPKMKFLHVIRDGRDMALSANNYFLKDHGDWMFGPGWHRDVRATQMELWRRGNIRAAETAEKYLCKGHYFLLRYEDLCQKPAETIAKLLEFVGGPISDAARFGAAVADRGSIGRWRSQGGPEVAELARRARAELERFGYRL